MKNAFRLLLVALAFATGGLFAQAATVPAETSHAGLHKSHKVAKNGHKRNRRHRHHRRHSR